MTSKFEESFERIIDLLDGIKHQRKMYFEKQKQIESLLENIVETDTNIHQLHKEQLDILNNIMKLRDTLSELGILTPELSELLSSNKQQLIECKLKTESWIKLHRYRVDKLESIGFDCNHYKEDK